LRPAQSLFGGLGLEQVRVKFFKDFEKARKAKWLSIVNPRPEDPANINLTLLYLFLALDTLILLPCTTNPIFNISIPQDLSDGKHLLSPPPKKLFGGLETEKKRPLGGRPAASELFTDEIQLQRATSVGLKSPQWAIFAH
jgi:hypothetical protein